jgi:hypothetical protein
MLDYIRLRTLLIRSITAQRGFDRFPQFSGVLVAHCVVGNVAFQCRTSYKPG